MDRWRLTVNGGLAGLVLVLWSAAPALGVNRLLVPPIRDVLVSLWDVLRTPATFHHLAVTAGEFAGAFAGAVLLGIALGAAVGSTRKVSQVLEPILGALHAVPIVVFYPLCLLYFGIGSGSKVVFGVAFGIFPILLNTIRGVQAAEKEHLDAARSMGASHWQIIRRVRIPAAMPLIGAGVRMAATLSLVSVIAGEMIASVDGLGSRISWASEVFEPGYLYAYILVVIMVIMVANTLSAAVGRRMHH